jgi:hypothetical protein
MSKEQILERLEEAVELYKSQRHLEAESCVKQLYKELERELLLFPQGTN